MYRGLNKWRIFFSPSGPEPQAVRPKRAQLALLVFWAAAICAPSAAAYDTLTLDIDGLERSARVFPGSRAHDDLSPLLLIFHGRGDNERDFSRAVRLHKDWPEATVVYPRGLIVTDERNMRGWLGSVGREDRNRDLVFVDRMIDVLEQRYRVDPRRIYAAGFSNGGRFTFVLMARKPEVFAAFVAVGALSRDIEGATRPKPVMLLFGRGEPGEFRDAWAQTVVSLVKLNLGHAERREWAQEYFEYPARKNGAQTIVSLYNAGHIWPYKGNEYIIRFLKSHQLNELK